VPASDVIDGKLGDGVEEVLKTNKGKCISKRHPYLTEQATVVPIVVVATKFDLAITQALIDIAGGDTQYYEHARTTAYERYDRSRRSLFRDVPVEIVSSIQSPVRLTRKGI
jgi:hypothetical protein